MKFRTFLIACFLVAGVSASAQSNNFENLALKITTQGEKVTMQCEEGCSWTELSFTLDSDAKGQFVDYYGMTSGAKQDVISTEGDSYFLFKLERRNEFVTLTSVDGLKWQSLSFTGKGLVTRSGVTKL